MPKTIELTNYKVTIKKNEDLTYNDVEAINLALMQAVEFGEKEDNGKPNSKLQEVRKKAMKLDGIKPEQMRAANRKTAEVAIIEIEDKEGKKTSYTEEWLNNLKPANDGLQLMEEINQETQDVGKKK